MKNIIFALTTCCFFLFLTTNTFAQTKVKKGKLKTTEGKLKQPAPQKFIRDSMYYLKNLDKTPQTTGSNSVQAANKPGGVMKKGPTVPGSIWDTLPPQVRGGSAGPKLQNQRATQNAQSANRQQIGRSQKKIRQVKGDKLQRQKRGRKNQTKVTQTRVRQGQKRKKTTKKNNY